MTFQRVFGMILLITFLSFLGYKLYLGLKYQDNGGFIFAFIILIFLFLLLGISRLLLRE